MRPSAEVASIRADMDAGSVSSIDPSDVRIFQSFVSLRAPRLVMRMLPSPVTAQRVEASFELDAAITRSRIDGARELGADDGSITRSQFERPLYRIEPYPSVAGLGLDVSGDPLELDAAIAGLEVQGHAFRDAQRNIGTVGTAIAAERHNTGTGHARANAQRVAILDRLDPDSVEQRACSISVGGASAVVKVDLYELDRIRRLDGNPAIINTHFDPGDGAGVETKVLRGRFLDPMVIASESRKSRRLSVSSAKCWRCLTFGPYSSKSRLPLVADRIRRLPAN